MKAKLRTTIAGCLAALATTAIQPAMAEEVTLKFSSFAPVNPIVTCGTIPFVDMLEANTGTKVTVERYFGGGAFGNPTQQYDQALRGITDISYGILTYTEGLFPLAEIIGLPFVIDDNIEATRVLNETILPEFLADSFKDVKVINLWLATPNQYHIRGTVNDLTNFNGMRVNTTGQVLVAALEALGAQVSSTPAPGLYENLQRGTIDGTSGPWTMASAFKIGEVTDHHYEVNFGAAIGFTVMNLDKYNSLPDDVKAIIDSQAGLPSALRIAGCFTKVDAFAKKTWGDKGNTIVKVPEETRAAMKAKVAPIIAEKLKALDDKGLPPTALLARIEEELAKAK